MDSTVLTPELLLQAYCSAAFPMAEGVDPQAAIHFYRPDERALLTVNDIHIPRRLQRVLRQYDFAIVYPADLRSIMTECGRERDESWINPVLLDAYVSLADAGFASALAVYDQDRLVGGIYWVQIGTAIMAESMFSRVPNASKIALMHLMAGVMARQRRLGLPDERNWIDVQYSNPHLEQFQPTMISEKAYQSLLDAALGFSAGAFVAGSFAPASFLASDFSTAALESFLQFKTQIS